MRNLTFNERAEAAARLIELMQSTNVADDILRYAHLTLGDYERITLIQPLRTIQRACWLSGGGEPPTFVACGVDLSTAGSLLDGWRSESRMRSEFGGNYNSMVDAARGVVPAFPEGYARGVRIRAYGHSGGGVLAEIVAKAIAVSGVADVSEIQTFGAPKPGYPLCTVGGAYVHRRRWMNYGDPVPGIPWMSFFGSVSVTLLFPLNDYNPGGMAHGSGGRRLSADGSVSFADDAQGVIDPDHIGVAEWLTQSARSVRHPHNIIEYIARLRRMNAQVVPGAVVDTPPIAHAPPPMPFVLNTPPAPANTTGSNVQSIFVVGNVLTTALTGVNPFASIKGKKMALGKIPVALRFNSTVVAGQYWIVWQDFLVARAPTASKARTMCKAGNRWLRTLCTMASVDANTLGDALASFLQAASVQGGQVNPPIVIGT